jgi:hypothetical protein
MAAVSGHSFNSSFSTFFALNFDKKLAVLINKTLLLVKQQKWLFN